MSSRQCCGLPAATPLAASIIITCLMVAKGSLAVFVSLSPEGLSSFVCLKPCVFFHTGHQSSVRHEFFGVVQDCNFAQRLSFQKMFYFCFIESVSPLCSAYGTLLAWRPQTQPPLCSSSLWSTGAHLCEQSGGCSLAM